MFVDSILAIILSVIVSQSSDVTYKVLWKNDEMSVLLATRNKEEALKYMDTYKEHHDMELVVEYVKKEIDAAVNLGQY